MLKTQIKKSRLENDSHFESQHDLLQGLCLRTKRADVGIPVIHCLMGERTMHYILPFLTDCTMSVLDRGIPMF